ncbi:MAG: peptide chain release factor N(5)-glutamine methyltransferase [Calditrichaeota bacterium]|nr:peptide chain release factor N(5)-glutamine methyltransferase [Calditrichota bacterium]
MQKQKTWKVIDLLKTTADFLKKKGIENPRLNAERLLSHVLDMERIKLYVEFARPVSNTELSEYRTLVSRRLTNEPLQYILGETEFMGLPFKVSTSVLIPRPETEILVEEIFKLNDQNKNVTTVLDIGTGSGCIPISLAHFWPEAHFTGIDISSDALAIAEENKSLNKKENVSFLKKDIFGHWPDENLSKQFDLIVSNPPYVTEAEMSGLQSEVKDFEPDIALTDFSDGLKFYKHIFTLVSDGILKTKFLFLEMSGSQPEKIVDEAKKCKFNSVEVIKDLTGIDRVLKIKLNE